MRRRWYFPHVAIISHVGRCLFQEGGFPLFTFWIIELDSKRPCLAGPDRSHLVPDPYLAAGGSNGLIQLWPTNITRKPTRQGLKTLRHDPTKEVLCLAFASDSSLLASGNEGEMKLCVHAYL
jgi:WD40 repeat protein